ncbi:pumilio-family RNA binding repeat domain-containing protein [Hirsutella rhossiliensis]
MDESRFRSQQSPRNETPMTNFVSPPRNGVRLPQQTSHDPRSNMPRRFTTDSSRVPTLSSVTSTMTSPQRGPALDATQEYTALHQVQLIEQKKLEYERIRERRRRFEIEMQRLDQQQRREAQELAQMEEEIGRLGGPQSEPTTPPEYHDNSGFPSIFSRPNRYSTSSLASPPGLYNRPARSGSQLTSPPSGIMQHRDDDEKEEAVRQDPTSHRSTNALNRYSMPVTRSRNGLYDMNLDQTNTTRFLFGDDEPKALPRGQTPDENFPTLVRREDQMLSASSAALDLALSPSPHPEPTAANGWNRVNRHRTQQSLSSINGSSPNQGGEISNIGSRPASLRNSLDLKYFSGTTSETSGGILSSQNHHNMTATPPRLQSSFSANDVPTVKNPSGPSIMGVNANSHAQQHFHNHNASIGRIPAGAMPTRGHTRELSNDNNLNNGREQGSAYPSIQSALQASAPPFGPGLTSAAPMTSAATVSSPTSTSMNQFHGFYPANGFAPLNANTGGSFGIPMLAAGMQQMTINGVNGGSMYPAQNYTGYGSVPFNQGGGQPRDSQARVMQHRRQLDSEAMSRYHNMPLESFRGQIYELCKDQHGCRYLQKKLEERNPDQVNMIWLETNQHVIELMMDPFGNYLCQKLLEFCNDDERTVLIQNASQDMVRIALNQHGTRALQKMIEYVSTAPQVRLIIEALRFRVVELIQDLNGNHVIQKCLNKLTSADAQFIFDAVGNNCVDVGTHRHGCCVLQRCIDHASGHQKAWLVDRITGHARVLVQDPFGNYVVQYIIDLNEPSFTDPVVQSFKGCIGLLSRHKFSSNVIEKCLRCAGPESKDIIVDELLAPQEMERHLRDSFGNYVVQTALEFATPHQKYRLVEAIRPLLPQIRNTPYGRRIQAKISLHDNRGSAASSGQATPADNTQGQISIRPGHARAMSGNAPGLQNNGLTNGGVTGLGSQGMRQNIPLYANNATPPASGSVQQGPVHQGSTHQPQFNQMAPAGYSPAHPANHPTDAGEPRWL